MPRLTEVEGTGEGRRLGEQVRGEPVREHFGALRDSAILDRSLVAVVAVVAVVAQSIHAAW